MYKYPCEKCGKEITTQCIGRKYCDECKIIVKREQKKLWYRKKILYDV